jgi:hypothetical protein|tara:strand:+ start:339 stop:674 length:336 start_codon:yes stop_codon:yes gene_type:complete
MPKIVFKNTSDPSNIPDDVNVNGTVDDGLDNVKIKQDEKLNVSFGVPSSGPVYIVGEPGPAGPTGPSGNYFYSNTAPGDIAVTGDRWFHPPSGLEFTKLQGVWIQLYRNIK